MNDDVNFTLIIPQTTYEYQHFHENVIGSRDKSLLIEGIHEQVQLL